MDFKKIGFIGLGIMGKPMAKNLLKAGYTDLLVNNLTPAPVQELEAAGAKGATQKEIGEQCDEAGHDFHRLLLHQPGLFQGDLRRAAEEGRRDAGRSCFRR